MAMTMPTYAKAHLIGQVHDLVVDISGFDKELGTISPEVIGRIIETFVKPEHDDYGVIIPTTSTQFIGLMDVTVSASVICSAMSPG